jgi:putative peptidoglycan lipid II flippase
MGWGTGPTRCCRLTREPGAVNRDVESAALEDLGRSTRLVAGLTLLSRISGFARIVIVTAVLGRTALGDVYQSVNLVPNLVFELVAAGTLQAVLLPTLVGAEESGGPRRAEALANIVLGWVLVGLGALAVLLAALSPIVIRLLFAGGSDMVRADKVELGVPFLLVFAPQLVCYGAGLVAAAVLQAKHRFGPPAVAPLVNNIVVITCYVIFDQLRSDTPPSLELTGGQIAVLAGGTTLGVIAFTAVPVIAAARTGIRWRPSLRRDDPALHGLVRSGAWAGATVAATQLLTAAVLVIGNGVEGAIPTFFLAFAVFQLPYALVAVPLATTRAPLASRRWVADDPAGAAGLVREGLVPTIGVLAAAGAAMVALAWPIVRVLAFGEAAAGDLGPLAHAVAAFGPGLAAYGALFYLTRISFAVDQPRPPAVAAALTTACGAAAMVIFAGVVADDERAAVLAACFSAAPVVGTVVLAGALSRCLGRRLVSPRLVGGALVAAAGTGAAMAVVAAVLDTAGRPANLAVLIVAGAAGLVVAAVAFPACTGRPLRELVGAAS